MRKRLFSLQDKQYKSFNEKLLPNINNIIGVRIPILRQLAKELARENWQNYKDELYYEEIMLQGLIIGYANIPAEKKLQCLKDFIPKINNWGVCDTVCSNLKFIKQQQKIVWKFIQPYLKSDKEFDVRFAIVILLNYFIDDNYIDEVLIILDKIKHNGYYAKMAVAWALSICFVKYWHKTFEYFQKSDLDNWTYNKTIQKTCESLRISKKNKSELKNIRRIQ